MPPAPWLCSTQQLRLNTLKTTQPVLRITPVCPCVVLFLFCRSSLLLDMQEVILQAWLSAGVSVAGSCARHSCQESILSHYHNKKCIKVTGVLSSFISLSVRVQAGLFWLYKT